ncbi:MAG: hypothetical protein WDN03_17250 [Rhizomicrobium sp.]
MLLRSIIGLNQIREGTIEVFGRTPSISPKPNGARSSSRWGVLFQEGALFSSQTIAENIQVPLREYLHMPQDLMNEIASMKLSMVGLDESVRPQAPVRAVRRHEEARRPRPRPGGSIRRSCSSTSRPPASTRSRPTCSTSWSRTCRKSLKLTVFMVTHDLDTLRATTDRIAVLVDLKIVVGTMDELRKNPHPWIQEYFSGPRGRAAA